MFVLSASSYGVVIVGLVFRHVSVPVFAVGRAMVCTSRKCRRLETPSPGKEKRRSVTQGAVHGGWITCRDCVDEACTNE